MTKHLYDRIQVLEREDELDRQQRLKAMARPLLSWYEGHARSLPWRDDPTPYRVWISEIMLQQTRVEAVKPYFERFMAALPTVQALAAVEDDRLMKLWEGLGYYTRARNLKKAALMITERHGGELPGSYEALLALPGIGSYTAGAIASIAFGLPVPAVDGNVLRVISRVLADREDIRQPAVKARMERELKEIMPRERTSQYNQGLIEVGAIVCVPGGEPRCAECPMESICLTRRQGLWKEIPVRGALKKRKVEELTVCLIRRGKEVAIHKRPDTGLLASLYELPNVPGQLEPDQVPGAFGLSPDLVEAVEPLPPAKHIFSHVEWHMAGYAVSLRESGEMNREGAFFFVERSAVKGEYPLPGAFKAYTKLI